MVMNVKTADMDNLTVLTRDIVSSEIWMADMHSSPNRTSLVLK